MKTSRLLVAAVTAASIATAAAPAFAVEAVPDISALQYQPIGHFKPGDPIPEANAYQADDATGQFLRDEMADGIFNPSGTFNAYDTNVFEVLAMPFRAAGDEFSDDPLGNGQDGGDSTHGRCSGDPRSDRPRGGSNGYPVLAGECFNHQLEYIEYYERTMMSILGKFGAFTKRYEFLNPSDPGEDQFQAPFGLTGGGNTMGGRAINPAIIVPGTGADADETIVIGAHFDKTNDGPAAAWDSQEGHAQMIRVAKLMADYWDAKGARPTATVKFIPWDGEESGTLGSQHYVNNVIPPGDEEVKVRGYWNTDPCAGGYPAFRFGNRANRTQLGIQLANPLRGDDPVSGPASLLLVLPENLDPKYHARINAFNDAAPAIVEQVFDHLDDELTSQPPDSPQIFVSTAEGPSNPPFGGDISTTDSTKPVVIGKGRPFLFSSDWRNFEDRGIPFFNPGPEITGPSSFGDPGNPDALVILHSPNDNLDMMNRYAGAPQGEIAEGWVKGMEMCAHLLAWGMLQPSQGGASLREANTLTAYYEALPNEAGVNEPVHFDASGSHVQTAGGGTSTEGLEYAWDFGDGTTGTGRDPYHRYAAQGTYQSKLTVTNTANGDTATMEVPIVIQAVPAVPLPIPQLEAPETDEDGTFDLGYSIADMPGNLSGWQILEAADYKRLLSDDMEAPVDEKWTAGEPTHADMEPWQESDSSTRKFRQNQRSSGAQSYWTGVSPENFKTAPVIQQGESVLTLKEPFQVPQEAGAALTYNTLYQSEGDDRGIVQVAEARDGELAWETVDQIGPDPPAYNACAATEPEASLLEGMRQRGADLSTYAGKRIFIRFVYALGAENRHPSHPCGWYIDDIEVAVGTFRPIDRTDQKVDVGQFFEGTYTVKERTKGLYAYRVRGLYPPNGEYEGAPSNIRVVEVTQGANPKAPPQDPPRTGEVPPPAPQACPFAPKFRNATARRRGRGLRFDFATLTGQPARIDVFQATRGRRVFRARRVARFAGRTTSFAWNGRSRRRLTNGFYFARFMTGTAEDHDIRRVTLVRSKGRFRVVRPHYRRSTCGILRTFKLSSPAFGGRNRKRLGVAYRLGAEGSVGVVVRRGKKVVRRFRARTRSAAVIHRLSLRPRGLRRGVYRVTVTVTAGGRSTRSTLFTRKL